MRIAGLPVSTLVFGLLVVIVMAVPVAAHGNLLAVDSQVSADGTVRIEGAYLITTGWIVLHADDNGNIGTVIGHKEAAKNSYHENLSVAIDRTYWDTVTNRTPIWAVLHYDANGNGQFDPAADPPTGGQATPANAHLLTVAKGEQPAYVLAATEHAQKTNVSEVVIRRAALPDDGFLVVRANANGSAGEVLGYSSLPAGRHEAVTVPIEDHEYHHRPEHFSLWAVVYADDGDDAFDEGDHPVTVNNAMVASQFSVERTGDIDADHQHTATVTETDEQTTAQTNTDHDQDDHQHEESTTTSPNPTTIPPTSTEVPTQPDSASTTETPGQPGFGVFLAILAMLGLGTVGRRLRIF